MERTASIPAIHRSDEIADDCFSLANDPEIGLGVDMWAGRKVWSAYRDKFAARVEEVNQIKRVDLLYHHSAGQNEIGPRNISLDQFFSVAIDKPEVPVWGEQRCDGNQAKGGGRIARADDLASGLVVPERIGEESRIDQQNVKRRRASVRH
jgi:hypothetical protein